MKEVNYTKEGVYVKTEKDGVIVRKCFSDLAGGRALDMTDYPFQSLRTHLLWCN